MVHQFCSIISWYSIKNSLISGANNCPKDYNIGSHSMHHVSSYYKGNKSSFLLCRPQIRRMVFDRELVFGMKKSVILMHVMIRPVK